MALKRAVDSKILKWKANTSIQYRKKMYRDKKVS